MNILLWVVQILLALWNLIGGIFILGNHEMVAKAWAVRALPKPAWVALGVLQVLFALGLVLPGVFKVWPKVVPISAACLVVISLLGLALYVAYVGFPGILWAVVPAVLAAFVAYGRFARSK